MSEAQQDTTSTSVSPTSRPPRHVPAREDSVQETEPAEGASAAQRASITRSISSQGGSGSILGMISAFGHQQQDMGEDADADTSDDEARPASTRPARPRRQSTIRPTPSSSLRASDIGSDDAEESAVVAQASRILPMRHPGSKQQDWAAHNSPRARVQESGDDAHTTTDDEAVKPGMRELLGERRQRSSSAAGPSAPTTSPSIPSESPRSPADQALAVSLDEASEGINDQMRVSPRSEEDRKTLLAEKVKEVFGLPTVEPLTHELSCWLYREILIQGYMYLTASHACFYAHMPRRYGQVLRSGSLTKRSSKTRRYSRHWFILRNSVFSWYSSSTDPYFPEDAIDLEYCTSVESSLNHSTHFKVAIRDRRYHFAADSRANRDEWVKILRKAVFRTQHKGESVKIIIPASAIDQVTRQKPLDFAETIQIEVREQISKEHATLQFAYFADLDLAMEALRFLSESAPATQSQLIDTTTTVHPTEPTGMTDTEDDSDFGESRGNSRNISKKSSLSALAGHIKPGADHSSDMTGGRSSADLSDHDSLSRIRSADSQTTLSEKTRRTRKAQKLPQLAKDDSTHTYPPSSPHSRANPLSPDSSDSWSLTSVLKRPAKTLSGTFGSKRNQSASSEAFSPDSLSPSHSFSQKQDDQSYSFVLDKDAIVDDERAHRSSVEAEVHADFRKFFKVAGERVIESHSGWLARALPVYGRVFVSTHFVCFRADLISSTKMVLPLTDVIAVQKHRAYRPGYSSLVIVVKGHEEIFFEFGSSSTRDRMLRSIEGRAEYLQDLEEHPRTNEDILPSTREAEMLKDLEPRAGKNEPLPPPETSAESVPPLMFRSTSSTFLNFRPHKSLHFTCLTIGSRGDVQPYIALCKGLIAEGHTCRIASHGEYRKWVESFGIEFGEIGGDPAELMKLCVDHGMFTVSFIREGLVKFKGWLDDLLKTSYEACKGTDVLIESPSAMAGLHIAECLQIPYFRAFTMPWTRTRAYPHAFAVPDTHMGGSYNWMTYTLFDSVFWKAISGQVNSWRKHTLGLRSTSADRMRQQCVPFLYNFSPSIVPVPLDWPEYIHITGYWYLDNADDSGGVDEWTPPDDLVAFLDRAKQEHKKVVYIGFGSIVVSDPDALTKTIVEAVNKSDVYAVLSKGWSDRGSKKSATGQDDKASGDKKDKAMMSNTIFNIKSCPHDWLFARVNAACHHGGAGTCGASFRAGIPTIIRPFFGDQHFWADRVDALGIGTALKKLTVDSLSDALIKATIDEKQIARARMVGQNIRKENGVANAIEAIYRDLEYAKDLIASIKTKRVEPEILDTTTDEEHDSLPRTTTEKVEAIVSGNASDPSDESSWDLVHDQQDQDEPDTGGQASKGGIATLTGPMRKLLQRANDDSSDKPGALSKVGSGLFDALPFGRNDAVVKATD
ncbi:glycosyltransferase family 1 protein [Mixia osmundae IAM 14324]|uniref:Sterol 3-beta-glucosyltransferase n=1 Tax=Mixia osmundae (strain CBS 9802 / IAM 14324 / JCM 22182 / KY 12970) TaxID=764103 RepID=G7EAN5_MIXOS|nr:glycosyltransferase family 1 protein [Mixia osmundae IAM 14324]KEI40865.1 glycosyltransferase family 1 protein [Mixia osmundae IAM 14324]GAA99895.1 hypothetical protein E5Q_06598 [Mixia osmundae IAM 14324]